MPLTLLHLVGSATVKHGAHALTRRAAFGEAAWDIAKDAFSQWKTLRPDRNERRQDVEALVNASAQEIKRETEIIAQAATLGPGFGKLLVAYLESLPGFLRRSLAKKETRPKHATDTHPSFAKAEDLMALLPPRPPLFKPGDMPLSLDLTWTGATGLDKTLELIELLGLGGFGEVWKARQTTQPNAPPVAIKFLFGPNAARLAGHEEQLNRLMGEAGHPGIVKLLKHDVQADPPWLAFEYVDGGDLGRLITAWAAAPPVDLVEQSIRFMHQLADILAYVHALPGNIVHRDLKPSNILLQATPNGPRPRVADLGIGGASTRANLSVSVQRNLATVAGEAFTPVYASPEQQRIGSQPDPKDDVYALGVIWYHMLTGRLGGQVPVDPAKLLRKRNVPEAVITIIQKCLDPARDRLANARVLAAELAKLLPRPEPFTNSLGMKFAFVPAGTFWMSENEVDAKRQVRIPNDFWMGTYQVTQAEWQAVMGNNPSWFSRSGDGKDKVRDISDADLQHFPVEQVSWEDCQAFIKKLNDLEKARQSGFVYRLPTEAEWEYACRGAATSQADCSFDFYFDRPTNDLSSKQANFDGNHPAGAGQEGPYLERTCQVGLYPPNALGLYDMHGNVWEWCEGGGSYRVSRGGSWYDDASSCRATYRSGNGPASRRIHLGVRLVRSSMRE